MNLQSTTHLVIAHRGARAFAPENTLEAFRKAAELGADMVELDVQLTADEQLIVVHDDTLDRCSNVREVFGNRADYRVRSFTLLELRRLDAGSWFVRELERKPEARQPFLHSLGDDELHRFLSASQRAQYASGQLRQPTLREALVECRNLRMRVNIELKGPNDDHTTPQAPLPDALIAQVVQQIRDLGMGDRVLISSFDHTSLRRVKDLDPALPTGVLVTQRIADPVEYCRELRAVAYHPGCMAGWDAVGFDSDEFRSTGRLLAASESFRALRQGGIAVNVWTENDPDRMQHLIDAGASGIFTDYPNRLRALLANRWF